ncbi:MAG TPA: PQQ-binding-like beta-propeller repeat protein [Verrucomicrobiae bacterium]|nr:PQQ-binding-like beta-propeller repeat protein [Verrucomicrobiae bacterium]
MKNRQWSKIFKACIFFGLLAMGISARASDWPQWRGLERDGHVPADAQVPVSVSTEPKVDWKLQIGGGFSSPVVAGGKLVYLDAQDGKEIAHMLDAKTGKEIWRATLTDSFEDEWGPGPRSTPIMDGDRVYTQSCNGEFRCLNAADGKVIWGTSFAKDFGVTFLGGKANEGTASRRGNNGCGVIDGEHIILPVGSKAGASAVCFDKRNGKVLWKTGNDEAAYSSLLVENFAGTKQIIYFTSEALMGMGADDGRILWRVPLRTDAKRHAMTPVIFGDTISVNSQTIGLVCFKITKEGDAFKAERSWTDKDLKINLATPVLVDHYLYCQGAGKNYVCVDALNGKKMWDQEGFGDKVSVSIVMGKNILVTTDKGDLFFIAANPEKYTELAHTQVCGKSWSSPAYADGKLFVREGLDRGWKITCFDLMAGNRE